MQIINHYWTFVFYFSLLYLAMVLPIVFFFGFADFDGMIGWDFGMQMAFRSGIGYWSLLSFRSVSVGCSKIVWRVDLLPNRFCSSRNILSYAVVFLVRSQIWMMDVNRGLNPKKFFSIRSPNCDPSAMITSFLCTKPSNALLSRMIANASSGWVHVSYFDKIWRFNTCCASRPMPSLISICMW